MARRRKSKEPDLVRLADEDYADELDSAATRPAPAQGQTMREPVRVPVVDSGPAVGSAFASIGIAVVVIGLLFGAVSWLKEARNDNRQASATAVQPPKPLVLGCATGTGNYAQFAMPTRITTPVIAYAELGPCSEPEASPWLSGPAGRTDGAVWCVPLDGGILSQAKGSADGPGPWVEIGPSTRTDTPQGVVFPYDYHVEAYRYRNPGTKPVTLRCEYALRSRY